MLFLSCLFLFLVHLCSDSLKSNCSTIPSDLGTDPAPLQRLIQALMNVRKAQAPILNTQRPQFSNSLCFDVLDCLCFWGSRKGGFMFHEFERGSVQSRTPLSTLVVGSLLWLLGPPRVVAWAPLGKRTEGAWVFLFDLLRPLWRSTFLTARICFIRLDCISFGTIRSVQTTE